MAAGRSPGGVGARLPARDQRPGDVFLGPLLAGAGPGPRRSWLTKRFGARGLPRGGCRLRLPDRAVGNRRAAPLPSESGPGERRCLPQAPSIAELGELGVARVSWGQLCCTAARWLASRTSSPRFRSRFFIQYSAICCVCVFRGHARGWSSRSATARRRGAGRRAGAAGRREDGHGHQLAAAPELGVAVGRLFGADDDHADRRGIAVMTPSRAGCSSQSSKRISPSSASSPGTSVLSSTV